MSRSFSRRRLCGLAASITIIISASIALLANPASATTIVVSSGADSGAGTLRAALASANAGDVITFDPSVSVVELTTGRLDITTSVTITGSGTDSLTVRRSSAGGTPTFGIFYIDNAAAVVSISDMTITNGNATGGGVNVHSATRVNLTRVAVTNNTAGWGAGLWLDFADLYIDQSTFTGNAAGADAPCGYCNGGAMILNTGNAYISNSTISGNTARDNGGGIKSTTHLFLTNTSLVGNVAMDGFGGAIAQYVYQSQHSLSMTNTLIAGNTFASRGQCDVASAVPLLVNLNNLIEDNSCNYVRLTPDGSTTAPTAFLSGNPNAAALASNGGPTQTNAILSSSIAAGAGDPTTCAASPISGLDQRGFARPSACSIGAFEPAASAPTSSSTTIPGAGSGSSESGASGSDPVVPVFAG